MSRIATIVFVIFLHVKCSYAQEVSGDPTKWLSRECDLVLFVDDLSKLKDAATNFPYSKSEQIQNVKRFLFEGESPVLELKRFTMLQTDTNNLIDDLELHQAIFGLISSKEQLSWVLVVKTRENHGKKREDIQRYLDTTISTEFFKFPAQKISFEFVDSYLVLSNDADLVTSTKKQMIAPSTDFKPIGSRRRFLAAYKRLVELNDNDKRISCFFNPKAIFEIIPESQLGSAFSKTIVEMLDINNLLMAGIQISFFDQGQDPSERTPLLGASGYLTVAVPRSGIHAAFGKPIENVLPIHEQSLVAVACRVDLNVLVREVNAFLARKFGDDALATWGIQAGYQPGFEDKLASISSGTFSANMFRSSRTGKWVTIQGMQVKDIGQAETAIELLSSPWPKDKASAVEIAGYASKLYNDSAALSHVGNWVLSSQKTTIADYVEGFDPESNIGASFNDLIESVKSKFRHQDSPFFVADLSPLFWRRWLSEVSQANLGRLEESKATKRQRLAFALNALKLAVWESLGHQVVIASSDDHGIHLSSIIFNPAKELPRLPGQESKLPKQE